MTKAAQSATLDGEKISQEREQRFTSFICPSCGSSRLVTEFPQERDNEKNETIYVSLNADKREVQVITIAPGAFNENIYCKLNSISLNDNPSYTALSYCWGDAKQRGDIYVNGQKVSVTKSLELALRYMRDGKEETIVWADAICINQNDMTEKSVQVGMMGQIYIKASLVWIWLGESADNSDIAMDLIKSISEINFEDPNFHPDPVAWSAIKSLFERPWWGRLWIVQEAILARKVTFHCGKKAVDLGCFVQLKEIEAKYRRVPEERLKPIQSGLTSPFSLALSDWRRLRGMIQNGGGIPLFQMLTTTGKAQCFLPVDKIFGLLSMCTAADRQIIRVNYELCTRCVVLRVAKYFFIMRESSGPLIYLQTHQANKDPSFPSWLPDYTKDDYENHLIFPATEECTPYRAGANNAAWTALGLAPLPEMDNRLNSVQLHLEDEGTYETLILPGLILDIITAAYPAPDTEFYTGPDLDKDTRLKEIREEATIAACKEWLYHIRHDLLTDPDPYKESCGRKEAFWRTIIADRDFHWKGPPTTVDFADRFEAWLGEGDRATDVAYTRPFSDAAINQLQFRSFVVTEKGYFGLGRSATRPGDVVCVLRGGNVPFILRTRGDGCYDLVGEVYIHGIMDGGFVRGSRKEDLVEFRIR